MSANDNTEINHKLRQLLNQGIETLGTDVVTRLYEARRTALDHNKAGILEVRLVGIGSFFAHGVSRQMRNLVMMITLSLGAVGTYYWNGLEQAQEHEEIDSALLADELPPSAYLDPGFQAWLESTSHSSSSQN